MIASLTKENEILQNTNEVLKKENSVFKEKIKDLENSLSNVLKKRITFLERKKYSLDKAGLGFNPFKRKKVSKNNFDAPFRKSQIKCFYCQKRGHMADQCFLMNKSQMVKKVLVPKGTLNTNTKDPDMGTKKNFNCLDYRFFHNPTQRIKLVLVNGCLRYMIDLI